MPAKRNSQRSHLLPFRCFGTGIAVTDLLNVSKSCSDLALIAVPNANTLRVGAEPWRLDSVSQITPGSGFASIVAGCVRLLNLRLEVSQPMLRSYACLVGPAFSILPSLQNLLLAPVFLLLDTGCPLLGRWTSVCAVPNGALAHLEVLSQRRQDRHAGNCDREQASCENKCPLHGIS